MTGGRSVSWVVMKGKTNQLYHDDGVPTVILTAEIINRSGKVLIAPRARLADLAQRPA